jgi:hypothetical protein
MIGHQAVGMQTNPQLVTQLGQGIEVKQIVIVGKKTGR